MAKTLDEILDQTFDSRDIIERIEELENENTNDDGVVVIEDEDDADEYRRLKDIVEEASGYSDDFEFGVTLIRDDYFVDYAQEFAEDIGAIPETTEWPASYINWDAAADALQMDYTSIDIEGETYWYR